MKLVPVSFYAHDTYRFLIGVSRQIVSSTVTAELKLLLLILNCNDILTNNQ
jgi:hypothetical protein